MNAIDPLRKRELLLELRGIEFKLSPENLYQDGERPRAQAQKIEARLKAERAKIVKELGYEPTFKEIFGY